MKYKILKFILENSNNNHMFRCNIKPGMKVDIVLKKDQRTGIITTGKVMKLLTSKERHTRGIKVMLTDGKVGRVQKIYC